MLTLESYQTKEVMHPMVIKEVMHPMVIKEAMHPMVISMFTLHMVLYNNMVSLSLRMVVKML